jgi:hypothetical protein
MVASAGNDNGQKLVQDLPQANEKGRRKECPFAGVALRVEQIR